MEQIKNVELREIWLDEGTISHIFICGNSVYVIGNILISDPRLEKELEDIKEELFDQGMDLINVVYSDDMQAYYITRAGSEAEALLGADILSLDDYLG